MPASCSADLDGPVHWVDHGGPASAAPVVLVHGLGGSHASWADLGPLLAESHRVLALDLAGFGRTPRAGRSSSVRANQGLLHRFLTEVVGEPAVLVGSSMGGTICLLEAADSPELVRGLVLVGPALPRTRTDVPDLVLARRIALCAVPGVAERTLVRRRRRLGAEALVDEVLRMSTADVTRVSPRVRALAVELAVSEAAGPDAEAAWCEAARSLGLLVARSGAYRSRIASVRAPALVLQGSRDRLVPASGVRQLAALQPGWPVHVLDGVGHVPHVEDPAGTAAVVLPWLAALPAGLPSDPPLLAGAS